jgi:hypothetical protein
MTPTQSSGPFILNCRTSWANFVSNMAELGLEMKAFLFWRFFLGEKFSVFTESAFNIKIKVFTLDCR